MSQKTTTYFLIIVGMTALFYFTGIGKEAGTILDALLDLENYNTSLFWVKTIGALSIGLITAIFVGYFTKNAELGLMAPIATFLGTAFLDFIKIFLYIANINIVIAILFIGPLIMLIPFVIVDYWRGRDT
jgi:hypothetical protein